MRRSILIATAFTLLSAGSVLAQTCTQKDLFGTVGDVVQSPKPYAVFYGSAAPNTQEGMENTLLFTGEDMFLENQAEFQIALQCASGDCADVEPYEDTIFFAEMSEDGGLTIDTAACSPSAYRSVGPELLEEMRIEVSGILGTDE